ncbi:YHS domain-containing protein [Botrimarina hoheduenensis]|uniref:YHS domain-containing protein n=1 Tax=Botrimarina hoheduenensis TaxID=2528000 RepID=UPI001E30687C|nr:YHS domain-containing protein [Botrimarina hoheduenensis]
MVTTSSAALFAQAPAAKVGLDGYCPVCIIEMKQWEKGDARFQTDYDGTTYYFPGAKQKAMFDANPEKYTPAAGGDCVVCQVEMGARKPGKVEFAALQADRLFLFPSQKEKDIFLANPDKYAQADLAYDGNCAVCKIDSRHDNPGREAFATYYQGKRYLFPSEPLRQAFLANPAKYAER